jgi:hypothetical protein
MTTPNADPTVTRALDVLAPADPPDTDGALRRQLARQAAAGRPGASVLPFRLARALPLAAVLVLALSFLAPPVRSTAAQLLTIFRVQDVAPITIDSLSQPLPNLTQLGDMSPAPRDVRMQPVQVADAGAASAQVGFTVQTPSQLPAGLANPPSAVAVTTSRTINFTFRAQKARAYLDSTGHKDVAVPPKFDGATLTLRIPATASLAYLPAGASLADLKAAAGPASAGSSGAKPDTAAVNRLLNGSGVVIIEAKSPELDATGVSADELRDFLLSLPGIPDTTKAQLRAIGDWRSTLPVPATAGSNLHKVSVNGAPGVAGKNANAEMVLWIKNGILYVATAPKLDEKTLLGVAASVG